MRFSKGKQVYCMTQPVLHSGIHVFQRSYYFAVLISQIARSCPAHAVLLRGLPDHTFPYSAATR